MGKTKSRANGDGDVFPRKNKAGNTTSYRGAYVGPDGKRRYVSGKTKEEARKALREARSGADQGLVFDAARLTWPSTWTAGLRTPYRAASGGAPMSLIAARRGRYIIPAIGRVRLKALTPAHVQGLYREMQDRGLSARTVEYTHAVLHRALKQAMRWSMVPRNVCDAVDVPQVRREEMHPLRPEQARRFLEAARGERLEALYVVAVHAGLRPGELLALGWEDVDLDRGDLARAPRSLRRRVHHAEDEAEPEKDKPQRRKHRRPQGHRKRQLEERMARAGLWQDHGLVSPPASARRSPTATSCARSRPLLRRAGLPASIRLYDLRHTCATLLLSRNVHPKYVQELLGHASIAQTLDTYSHVLPGMDGGIGDAIDEALG